MEPEVDCFYRMLAHETPDAIVHTDAEGRIAFWNGGAEPIIGFVVSEAIGQSHLAEELQAEMARAPEASRSTLTLEEITIPLDAG